jgi:DNA-binding response OmpR family regulator
MKDNHISQAAEPVGAPLQCPAKPPHRILVVEDDGDIRQLNTEALINSGYHVDAAEDGAVAWDNLQLNGYDLLVTDNDMPKVTGVDLLKKLHAARMSLPVIMATGTLPREEFNRHPGLQPIAMLIKPYTIEELLGTVRKVLSEAVGTGQQTAPPPTWQNQALSDDWELL